MKHAVLHHGGAARWIAGLVTFAIACALQVTTATHAAAAPGDAWRGCQHNVSGFIGFPVTINGRSRELQTVGNLMPGSVVRISATGSVHNGTIFGQWRGPDGETNVKGDANWPAPSANKFALYGRWNRTGAAFQAGHDSGCLNYTPVSSAGNGPNSLAIGINDDVLSDNDGSFQVSIRVWNNPSDVFDGGFEQQTQPSISSPWAGEGTGYKGVDLNKGYSFSGRNNAFIRTSTGWNAITQTIWVTPYHRYRMAAWIRTSGNFDQGYLGVRRGTGSTVVSQLRYGAWGPSPYQLQVLDFDSGPDSYVTAFVGYTAPGTDSWIQIDDVAVRPH